MVRGFASLWHSSRCSRVPCRECRNSLEMQELELQSSVGSKSCRRCTCTFVTCGIKVSLATELVHIAIFLMQSSLRSNEQLPASIGTLICLKCKLAYAVMRYGGGH